MSHNQSRADKSEAQLKKPGRSGNSSSGIYQKSHSSAGGKAGGGYAPPGPPILPSSSQAHNPNPLSTNQSFKRPGNGQGGQYRVNLSSVTAETSGAVSAPSGLGMQNGSYTPPLSHVQSVAKPADTSGLRTSRPIPRPPPSQTATYVSNANTRAMPAKGETPNSVNLQFGSINPGYVNGRIPIPARTSSAPPNLDEQKHEQAHHRVSMNSAPTMPTSAAPKTPQVQPRSEVPGLNQANTVTSHPPTQAKKESHSQISFPSPISAQKSSAIPVSGVPMFEKHQGSIPFSTHGPQSTMPSHLHIPYLPVPVGTPQQNQQQMYYQAHMMQPPQPMIQQGHGLSFSPIGHQLPSHMNMGMDINAQMTPYSQQQTGKYGATGPRRAVKITHPDTKEELRLGKRTEYSLPAHSQSQPIAPFSQNPNNFYSTMQSNSFGPGSIYYPNTQPTTNSQATRFNYVAVSQQGASVSIANPPSQSTVQQRKYVPSSTQGISQPVNLVQPRDVHLLPADKTGTPSIKVSLPGCKDEAINVVKSIEEISLAQKVSDVTLEPSVQKQKSVSVIQPSCSSNVALQKMHPDSLSPTVTNPLVDIGLVSLSTVSKEDPRITSDNFRDSQFDKKEIGKFQQKQQALENSDQPHIDFEAKSANITSTSEVVSIENKDTRVVDSPNGTAVPKENRALVGSHTVVSVSDGSSQGKPEHSQCITSSTTYDDRKETTVAAEIIKPEKQGDTSRDRCDAEKVEPLQDTNIVEQYDSAVAETSVKEATIKYVERVKKSIDSKEEDVCSVSECSKIGVDIVKGNESFADRLSDDDTPSSLSVNDEISSLNVVSTDPARLFSETDVSLKQSSDVKVPDVSSEDLVFSSSTVFKDQSQTEMTLLKTTAALKRKKRKEVISKADAAGMNSDLYMAYKAPEEKVHTAVTSENMDSSLSLVDPIIIPLDSTKKEMTVNEEGTQGKGEVDDWEDAEDMSTQKLRAPDNLPHGIGSINKTYTRDFLMKFKDHFSDLPVGFVIGSDIAPQALLKSDQKSYPNSTKVLDWVSSSLRAEKWTKGKVTNQYVSNVTVRDIPPEGGHILTDSGFHPGSGSNPGVLRHPRGQYNQYISGNILGPTHLQADRWQRANGMQRGLIPSPQVSQMMHKAENKYEVGKVSDKEEAKQRQLKSILNKLTPQNFDKLFAQVKEVNIDNADTLKGVISQIFDKALMEPTFCEMYSNFCSHLSGVLPDFSEDNQKITFKRVLLNRCQEEFEKGEKEEAEAAKVEEEGEITQTKEEREEKKVRARRRMLGNIRLIGELYKKKMLTERIMHECIKKLITQRHNPDEEDIEALCKLLSTIGEMIDHGKARDHMNAYFDIMLNLSNNQNLSSRVRFMLKDAIDLRKNKWQQRRKVEGPKKIDEVHRDAVQERQAQASRLSRGPGMSSSSRRAPPMEYGHRGSTFSSSHGHRSSFQPQGRAGSGQDVRLEDRHPSEGRTLSASLQQRSVNDDSITLGPQGGLARGMSMRGQPLMATPSPDLSSNVGELRRIPSGPNGYTSQSDRATHYKRDQVVPKVSGNKEYKNADHVADIPLSATPINQSVSPEINLLSEDRLNEKSLSTIREYYSAKDVEEVILCIEEFKSPNYHPSMVSLWILDSFERKDIERDLLSKLLINICKLKGSLISQAQLTQGFKSVLSSLEDAVNDAPKAAVFLGRLFSKIILENLIPLKEVGELIRDGGEEPGSLIKAGHAAAVIGSILENIKNEKGVSSLEEVLRSSSLQLEDFRPPNPFKSANMLDAYL